MKKILISFDGTGNDAADAEQKHTKLGLGDLEDNSISNVLKLHLLFGGDLRNGNKIANQKCLYYSGVGTYGLKIKRAFNSMLGLQNLDVERIQKEARDDLQKLYQPGDHIYVFGFSRGAAIARQFVSRYVAGIATDQSQPVKFMGMFDTVASIGIPNLDNDEMPISDVVFEDRKISDTIETALHLISLDEKRKAFLPTLMNQEDRVTEVWFSGAHSDIGGGYRKDGLSDIPLQFILDFMRDKNLGLQILDPGEINYKTLLPEQETFKIDYNDVMLNPNPFAQCHQQERPFFTSKVTLGDRPLLVMKDDEPCADIPIVYHTVAERIYGDADYKPQSLVHETHYILMPDGEMQKFDGLKEHRMLGRKPLYNLEQGETRKIRVHACRIYNQSGIVLKKGQKYRFIIDFDQSWYDSSITTNAAGWNTHNTDLGWLADVMIRRKEDERRIPDAQWFEICGAIGDSDTEAFKVLDYQDDTGSDFEPASNGEFCPFANDLVDRYHNNLGFIDITIKRTA